LPFIRSSRMNRTLLAVVLGLGAAVLAAPPVYPDRTRLLEVRDAEGKVMPVRTAEDWSRRRAHVLEGMQEAMGPLPDLASKVLLDVKYEKDFDEEGYTRRKLTYQSEKGDRVPAWLLVPKEQKGKLPAMLCLHQTTKIGKDEPAGLGGKAPLHYGKELAQRGFVCLIPDYPSFGEHEYDFGKSPHPSGTIKAIWDNIRAVDLLVSLPTVDPDRIGVIGHSLG